MSENSYKLTTGIEGLDNLFFGGIHVKIEETSKQNNLIITIRGNRGVNKVHLGMPLCQGLCNSLSTEGVLQSKSALFFSLNKTQERLRSIFCNVYIQAIIQKIKTEDQYMTIYQGYLKNLICTDEKFNKNKFYKIVESIILPYTIGGNGSSIDDDAICSAIRDGLLYYNERTRHFHLRRPKRNDDKDCTEILQIDIDKLAEEHGISFFGKDELTKEDSNNLVEFHEVIHKLNETKTHGKYGCIVIDGLSKLTDKDMEQCPFDALVDLLRNKCYIGIISTDERLPISKIDPDIVIEMRVRPDEKYNFSRRELCISKCLNQQNAYGWHAYKLRNYGIEVFPSAHKLLYRRNYMDNAIPEALLPITKPSFQYWLEESDAEKCPIQDIPKESSAFEILCNNYKTYRSSINEGDAYEHIRQGSVEAIFGKQNSQEIINSILSKIYLDKETQNGELPDEVLFIGFSHSRMDFWEIIKKTDFQSFYDNIHFFRVRSGCISSDELLYLIEQQVNALTKKIRGNDESPLYHYYNKVHVVLGDLRLLEYGYPCLFDDGLFLPAYVELTKGNYMRNYMYMTGEQESLSKKMRLASDNIFTVEPPDNAGNS